MRLDTTASHFQRNSDRHWAEDHQNSCVHDERELRVVQTRQTAAPRWVDQGTTGERTRPRRWHIYVERASQARAMTC